MRQVALLRGINLGGKTSVPMKDLAAVFAAAGCRDVRTYIQSGNVVFDSGGEASQELAGVLTAAIEVRFKFRVPVVLRTQKELEAVLAGNPFQDVETPQKMLHVYFLDKFPEPDRLLQVDHQRSAPDEFVVQGREIFLRLPNGMGRTKLTNAYFDAKLGVICTARNWRTIEQLCLMMTAG